MNNRFLIFLLAVSVLLMAAGCSKNNSDLAPYGSGKLQVISGDNQSGKYGELLPQSIVLKINSFNKADKFYAVVKVAKGNGWVTSISPYQQFSTGDSIRITWSLGCDYPGQQVYCLLYSDSVIYSGVGASFHSRPSDSIVINANAVKPAGWSKACGFDNYLSYNSKIITDRNNNLYLLNGRIFSTPDGGYNWYPLKNVPHSGEVIDAGFNSKNEMYMVTKNSGVFYSKDLNNWTAINNGFIQPQDPTTFLVEDSALFVSYYFDGPYISVDNGNFWRKMLVGGGSQRYYYINRHPDGRLMLFDDWSSLKQSTDNGKTWSTIPLEYKYANYSIYDFKIDKSGSLYIGSGDATLAILDPQTFQGSIHKYYEWNASLQTVNNISFAGNDVYYLVNYNPGPGIYSAGGNWNMLNIGFGNGISYFFRKTNGAFLLFSGTNLYYQN